MVCMIEASTESERSKRIFEFEDFLGIGDEASKLVQEQKAKAQILQSVLAVEDAEEAERKVLKMKLAEEKIEATLAEEEEGADADEVIQAIRDTCNECIEQAINPMPPAVQRQVPPDVYSPAKLAL
ncbi:hypothetical protein JCGZ_06925 [Jatropha curcas]|uniref:Uncharacterized protein n=1 Tax=Jatropha curcas TaxID=180498 RepID=A0A067KRN9_JATCU|nr:hypothetical protein JCGZ_06925 [Jatropha curcas]